MYVAGFGGKRRRERGGGGGGGGEDGHLDKGVVKGVFECHGCG